MLLGVLVTPRMGVLGVIITPRALVQHQQQAVAVRRTGRAVAGARTRAAAAVLSDQGRERASPGMVAAPPQAGAAAGNSNRKGEGEGEGETETEEGSTIVARVNIIMAAMKRGGVQEES